MAWLQAEPDSAPELDDSIYEAIDELTEQDQEPVPRFAEFLATAGSPGQPYNDDRDSTTTSALDEIDTAAGQSEAPMPPGTIYPTSEAFLESLKSRIDET